MTDSEMAKAMGGGMTDEEMAAASAPDNEPEQTFLKPGYKPPGHRTFAHNKTADEIKQDLAPEPMQDAIGATAGGAHSAIDRYTLGLYGALLRGGAALHVPTTEQAVHDMDMYRAISPTGSMITDAPAYMAEGPVSKLSELVSKPIDIAMEKGGEALGPLSRRFLPTVTKAAATSGAVSGLHTASEGASPSEIAQDVGEGVAGGAGLTLPFAAGGSLLGAAGKLVQGSPGGRAREFLTSRGGEVSPGGVKLPPGEYAATGTTDADIGAQAEASAKKGLGMLNEEKKGVLGAVGRKIGRIEESPEGATLHDVSHIVQNMKSSLEELDTSPEARAGIKDMLAAIEKKQGQGFNPDTDPYMLSASDVNKMRRQLDRFAKSGTSNDAGLSPLKGAANDVRSLTAEGPFAEANAEYATNADRYRKSRRMLGITERPKTPEESRTAEATVKNLIGRPGQNSITAGGQTGRLAEFNERHPDIAQEFEKPELLRKKADLNFHLVPKLHGGFMERAADAATFGPLAAEMAMSAMGAGHVSPTHAAAGMLLGTLLRNAPALQGRLLYGPAQETQLLGPMLLPRLPTAAAAGRDE